MVQTPSIPGQTSLIPVNDCVLVKLDPTSIKETKYSTRTSGIAIRVASSTYKGMDTYAMNDVMLQGKRVYFEEYKEGARIKRDGELFCFIKIEDIRGYEHA